MLVGTRGTYGLYKNGISKLTYNHWDSYPSGLGKEMLSFARNTSIEKLNELFETLIMVDEKEYPTIIEKNRLSKLGYAYEDSGRELNWYNILGGTLGDLSVYEDGLCYMIEYSKFIKDSLYCEWAYIVNLDDETFEIYEGFQKEQNNNRYSIENPVNDKYYACKLISKIPLNELKVIKNLDDVIGN